jgi:hypothetical protein
MQVAPQVPRPHLSYRPTSTVGIQSSRRPCHLNILYTAVVSVRNSYKEGRNYVSEERPHNRRVEVRPEYD